MGEISCNLSLLAAVYDSEGPPKEWQTRRRLTLRRVTIIEENRLDPTERHYETQNVFEAFGVDGEFVAGYDISGGGASASG